jgi:hypothetical protein
MLHYAAAHASADERMPRKQVGEFRRRLDSDESTEIQGGLSALRLKLIIFACKWRRSCTQR